MRLDAFRSRVSATAGVGMVAAMLLLPAFPATAFAQAQSPNQQRCILDVNKAAAKIVKAQAKEVSACTVKLVTGTGHPVACFTADRKGKVEKARNKLASVVTKRCATVPDYGFSGAATATAAATGESVGFFTRMLLGFDGVLLSSDGSEKACVQKVQQTAAKLMDAKLKEFLSCKKRGLRDGTITSASELDACMDAMKATASTKMAKRVGKVAKAGNRTCSATGLSLFIWCSAGDGTTLAACIDAVAGCSGLLTASQGTATYSTTASPTTRATTSAVTASRGWV